MAKRRYNPRLAKSLRCYTIADAATLYDAHRQTVRHWLANGLQPIDRGRPIFIHGAELNRFHAERRQSGRHRCGPGELYCLGCRAPRLPAANMADYIPFSQGVGTLSAICPDCEHLMTQRVNARRLALYRAVLDVMIRPGPGPISESP